MVSTDPISAESLEEDNTIDSDTGGMHSLIEVQEGSHQRDILPKRLEKRADTEWRTLCKEI